MMKNLQNLQNQNGVYLPVIALALIGLFLIIIGLGIESSRIKNATAELRARLEEICKEASYDPVITSNALISFRNQVQDLLGRTSNPRRISDYIQVKSARLVIPTMLASDGGAPAGDFDFGSIGGVGTCQLDVPGQDCKFSYQVDTTSGEYPSSGFWDNNNNAGNTVACEMSATIDTFFSSIGVGNVFDTQQRDVVAKSVWWRPERVNATNPTSFPSGLTIAIATELRTKGWDRRFRFAGGAGWSVPGGTRVNYTYRDIPTYTPFANTINNDSFKDLYDPLLYFNPLDPVTIPGTGRHAFARPPTTFRRLFSGTTFLEFPQWPTSPPVDGLSSGTGGGGQRRFVSSADPKFDPYNYRFVPCPFNDVAVGGCDDPVITPPDTNSGQTRQLRLSDREEMLVACMNPLVLVRNVFLSTIVELASRHGRLRSNTEILHVNPQHRTTDPAVALPPPNNPALIVQAGNDLVARSYQIPFVSFYGGDAATTPANLRPHKGGWINPFTSGDPGVQSANADWLPHHALVTSQLRFCYHLYQGFNTTQGQDAGINRFSELTKFDVSNAGFEDSGVYAWPEDAPTFPLTSGSSRNYYLSHRFPNEDGDWDQDDPWGTTACGGSTGNRCLNAGELVSALGSTQNCPYMQDLRGAPAPLAEFMYNNAAASPPVRYQTFTPAVGHQNVLVPDGVCSKEDVWTDGTTPATSALDLRPDIIGTLRYLDDPAKGMALASPGIFPLVNIAPPPSQPMPTNLQQALNRNSHILLVTHQPLTALEVAEIRTLVSTGSTLPYRPITIAYFPSSDADSQKQQLDFFQCAFNVVGHSYFDPPNTVACPAGVAAPSPLLDLGGTPVNPSGNTLLVYSPFLAKHKLITGYDLNTRDPALSNAALPGSIYPESRRFLTYWLFLLGGGGSALQDGDEQLIANTARNVFYRRIITSRVLL